MIERTIERTRLRGVRFLALGLSTTIASGLVVTAASAQAESPVCSAVKIHAGDAQAGSRFGTTVSLSGDGIAVGLSWDGRTGFRAVYVFRGFRGEGGWRQEAKLRAPDRCACFGAAPPPFSAAFHGDSVVIGTMGGGRANGEFAGMAHVFRTHNSNGVQKWEREAKLIADDGTRGALLGSAVAVSANMAVVGAIWDGEGFTRFGSAYVFRFDPDDSPQWHQEAKLIADDREPDDLFGSTVAASGDTILVTASYDRDPRGGFGSVYVFRFDGKDWIQEDKLLADEGTRGGAFGSSLAISGDVAVVGAPWDHIDGENIGAVYVFRFDRGGSGEWLQETTLHPDDGLPGDSFGSSVSSWRKRILIGAPGAGAAYLFRFEGSGWTQEAKLLDPDGEEGDGFGASVALEGRLAVIGAPNDNDLGTNSGSVYVFDLDCVGGCNRDPRWRCDGDADGDGQVNPVDAALVQAAFGSLDDQDICNYDLTCDGQISPVDSGIVQSLFGTCDAPRDVCP